MYERNEADFELMYDEKRNNWSVYIGTWSNSSQSFADCLFYLSLSKNSDINLFYKELETFNKLFIENKTNIVEDIQTNGLNVANSVLNEHEINDILNELEYSDLNEGHITEDEQYIFNYPKSDSYLETTYKTEICNILKDAENIKTVYIELQNLKQTMRQNIYNDIYEYIIKE